MSRCLPLVSEEGDFHVQTDKSQILAALTEAISPVASEVVLSMVERLFLASRLLDEEALRGGFWRWASFPASLMGRSMLDVLSDANGFLFPRGYWNSPEYSEEQRAILHSIETARVLNRADKCPRAIRHVFVAWAVVKVGDRFLLRTREDKQRPGTKQFVFPGGRFRIEDAHNNEGPRVLLRSIEEGDWSEIQRHLEATLRRELKEELGLDEGQYVASRWVDTSPYRQVEGAGNRHAYSEYKFQLFHVQLGREAMLQMYSEIARCPDQFVWLSAQEVCAQRSVDGRYSAYLDALVNHFGGDFDAALADCPASFQDQTDLSDKFEPVDIPVSHGDSFSVGLTGAERSVDIPLDTQEHAMLLGLACHAKGYAFAHDAVMRFPAGWVKLNDEQISVCHRLSEKLSARRFTWIEVSDTGFARWRWSSNETYLDTSAFEYHIKSLHVNSRRWAELGITRCELNTALGIFIEDTTTISVSKKLALSIDAIEDERVPEADDDIAIGDFKKSVREALDRPLQVFGLRKFVRAVPQGKQKKLLATSSGANSRRMTMGEYAITIRRRSSVSI
ncbi:hypothetical protein C2L64_00805 [Paraburkholderia hospita]|uniref:Nudix hydrolase domain-containing protein n=2 Tax=Paraburkholderia hospita TaxID=169430 RepID=A0AAN1MH82_9BURK|nr:hypothetical protein C2L64_00805 [Paraburkholderia hospita]